MTQYCKLQRSLAQLDFVICSNFEQPQKEIEDIRDEITLEE
jgi:hypothetical protein